MEVTSREARNTHFESICLELQSVNAFSVGLDKGGRTPSGSISNPSNSNWFEEIPDVRRMAGYQSFEELGDDAPPHARVIHPDHPIDKGFGSWQNYIHDLDYFFTRVYRYHQRSGFLCILLNQVLELVQFIFVVFFTVFLINYVDYDMLFRRKELPLGTKVTIADVIIPANTVYLGSLQIFLIVFAGLFWIIRLLKVIQSTFVNLSIKSFYKEALKIQDTTQYAWLLVQKRLIDARRTCLIQDSSLNELDVHNRLLRHHNYLVALMNKGMIPLHYKAPLIGEMTYLSKGLLFNMNYLLFKGPLSLFECNWKLRDDVKSPLHRQAAAQRLANNCLILALVNLLLFPLIALWQLLTTFYAYAEALKRDPSMVLGSRSWSLYARWYCRHFNELDHQLDDRLNRGYKSATKYMNSFTSPALEIVARHLSFVAGSMLAVLICLTIFDEDVITVEHVITVMTGLGAVIAISRAFIRTETPLKHTQADLYTQILEHLHYMPHGYAPYSAQARNALAKLFQYKIVSIIEELVSPIVTPYILARHLRPRSQEIVDFFRNFTVDVQGTGDVCAFAMLNVKDNGNSIWKPKDSVVQEGGDNMIQMKAADLPENAPIAPVPESLVCTENGKLELSLIHFKLTNPDWNPHTESQQQFIRFVTSNAAIQEEGEDSTDNSKSSVTSTSKGSSPSTPSASRITEATRDVRRSLNLHPQQQVEVSTLNRERSRLLSEDMSLSSRADSNLAMTLSTLFLHEYAAAQPSSSGLSLGPSNEAAPLLRAPSSSRVDSSSTTRLIP